MTCQTAQKSQISDSKCHRELDTLKRLTDAPAPSARRQVVTRRAEGAVFKGNLKALAKYPSHLGQAFRPRAHEAGILAQNYLLAHLLKGGLFMNIYKTYWEHTHIYMYA